jgi:hypothetical protein
LIWRRCRGLEEGEKGDGGGGREKEEGDGGGGRRKEEGGRREEGGGRREEKDIRSLMFPDVVYITFTPSIHWATFSIK